MAKKNRTIKECIIDSLDPIDVGTGRKIFSIGFPSFLYGISAVIVHFVFAVAQADMETIETLDGDVLGGGGAGVKGPVTEDDVLNILSGNDLPRHLRMDLLISGFLDWFLKQDEPKFDDGPWCGVMFIANKWNEFLREKGYAER